MNGVDTRKQVVKLLSQYFDISRSKNIGKLSGDELFPIVKSAIDQGRPMVVYAQGENSAYHMMSIIGYDNSTEKPIYFSTDDPTNIYIPNANVTFFRGHYNK